MLSLAAGYPKTEVYPSRPNHHLVKQAQKQTDCSLHESYIEVFFLDLFFQVSVGLLKISINFVLLFLTVVGKEVKAAD